MILDFENVGEVIVTILTKNINQFKYHLEQIEFYFIKPPVENIRVSVE